MLIVISGTHGTGKTTTAYRLATKLKTVTSDEVRVFMEGARECPFRICGRIEGVEHRAEREAQWWLFARQLKQDLEAWRMNGITILDRGLVDVVGYAAAQGYHDQAFAMMETLKGLDIKILYEAVIFCPIVNAENYVVNDGKRSLDLDFRQRVENLMLEAWAEMGIQFTTEAGVINRIKRGGNT